MSELQRDGFLGALLLRLQGMMGLKHEVILEREGEEEGDGDLQVAAEDRVVWRPDAPDYGPMGYQPIGANAPAESLLDFEVTIGAGDIDRYWDRADDLVAKLDLVLGPRRGSAENYGFDIKRGKKPKQNKLGLVVGTLVVTLKRPALQVIHGSQVASGVALSVNMRAPDGSGPSEGAVP